MCKIFLEIENLKKNFLPCITEKIILMHTLKGKKHVSHYPNSRQNYKMTIFNFFAEKHFPP